MSDDKVKAVARAICRAGGTDPDQVWGRAATNEPAPLGFDGGGLAVWYPTREVLAWEQYTGFAKMFIAAHEALTEASNLTNAPLKPFILPADSATLAPAAKSSESGALPKSPENRS